jgi:hypothetical protein
VTSSGISNCTNTEASKSGAGQPDDHDTRIKLRVADRVIGGSLRSTLFGHPAEDTQLIF